MIKYSVDGSMTRVFEIEEGKLVDKLKPAVYVVDYNQMIGYYLTERFDQFEMPPKLYGSVDKRTNKIINTFNSREKSTGVLLTGTRGAGKSLLAKELCNRMITEHDTPVIMVATDHEGSDFDGFIEKLGVCVLFFDEFSKTYAVDDTVDRLSGQEKILGLLDGTSVGKRLTIMTENNEWSIADNMIDRPSRIFYHYRYTRLEDDVVRDYCKDLGLVESRVNELISESGYFKIFTFDILSSVVEEMLRYPEEPVADLLDDMNIANAVEPIEYEIVSLKSDANEIRIKPGFELVSTDGGDSFPIKYQIEDNGSWDNRWEGLDSSDIVYREGDTRTYNFGNQCELIVRPKVLTVNQVLLS